MQINIRRNIGLLTLVIIAGVLLGCKTAKLSDADEAYARGEYFEAQKIYRKVYNKLTKREDRPLRGEVAFKLGESYRMLNRSANAAGAYQNAVRYAYPDSMVYYYLGRSLQADGKYAQAMDAYSKFLEWQPGSQLALEGLRGCRRALASKDVSSRYVVKNAKLFNTRRSDYAPMFLGKDFDQLYFTTTSEKATGEKKSEITGMKKGDIWFAKKNERGQWERPQPWKVN